MKGPDLDFYFRLQWKTSHPLCAVLQCLHRCMHGDDGNKPPSGAWHRMSGEQNKPNLFRETPAPIGKSSASPLRPSLGVFRMPRWFIRPREYSGSSTIHVITWNSRIIFSLALWMAGRELKERKKKKCCIAIELQEAWVGICDPLTTDTEMRSTEVSIQLDHGGSYAQGLGV